MFKARVLHLVAACAAVLTIGCGSSSDNSGDGTTQDAVSQETGDNDLVPADTAGDAGADVAADTTSGSVYDPPDPATTYVYRVWKAGSSETIDMPARFGARETKAGREYRRLEVGDFTQAEIWGVIIWSNNDGTSLETGGAEVYNPGASGQPSFAYVFDEPLKGSFLLDEGATDETTASGKFVIGGQELPFDITLTFTLVSKDESVTVPAGTIDHCIHYKFVENSTDLSNFNVDYWIKSGVGMVKATVIPGFDALELVSVTLPD